MSVTSHQFIVKNVVGVESHQKLVKLEDAALIRVYQAQNGVSRRQGVSNDIN